MGPFSLAAWLIALTQAAHGFMLDSDVARQNQPALPGCYVFQPNGCPRLNLTMTEPYLWVRDVVGELRFGAHRIQEVCEYYRKLAIDAECGTSDCEMLFVPNPTATLRRRAGENVTAENVTEVKHKHKRKTKLAATRKHKKVAVPTKHKMAM